MGNDCSNCRNPKVIVACVVIGIGFIFIVVGITIGLSAKDFNKDKGVSNGNNMSSGPSARRLKGAGN